MSGMYVFGVVPKHNEERVPAPDDVPADAADADAFDHELVEAPQPYFPVDRAERGDEQQ
jgi:hypothetical protein